MGGWLSVEEARERKGLRLVLSVGVPGPWGEAAKGILHAKGLPFEKVVQRPGETDPALVAWTGESNAPQLVYDRQAAVDRWSDIVLLAERLAPEPPLIPGDPADRATMFGLLHELCGEDGFGWSRRLMLFAAPMGLPEEHPGRRLVEPMALRYGWSEGAAERAPERAAEIIRLLASRLGEQRAAGREYLIGESLSALDIYWAAFAALVEPLPPELCPMPAALRAGYGAPHPVLDAAMDPALLEHRSMVYERHLELPIDLGP